MKVYLNKKDYNETNDKQYVIIDGKPETKNLCETYTKYGHKSDCDECSCYSLENQTTNLEIAEEIIKKSEIDINTVLDEFDCDHLSEIAMFDFVEFVESKPELQKIREELENHTEAEVFNYWDGSNWQTLILKIENDPWDTDLQEIDEDLEKSILEAFKDVDRWIEGVDKEVVVGNFKFLLSRMQGFFFEAIVEEV